MSLIPALHSSSSPPSFPSRSPSVLSLYTSPATLTLSHLREAVKVVVVGQGGGVSHETAPASAVAPASTGGAR